MPRRRHSILLLAAAASLASILPAANLPSSRAEEEAPRPWTYDDILRLRDISDPRLSPDGRWVVFVVSEADEGENAFNTDLYLASVAGGPEPIRLTRSPKADSFPRWKPDGSTIAFLSARPSGRSDDSEERGRQVWLIRPDGGEPWRAGPVPGSVAALEWSPDGRSIALRVTEAKSEERKRLEKEKNDAVVVDREFQRDQVWLLDPVSGASVQVTRGALHITDIGWSPDGARLVLAGQPTPRVTDGYRADIYILDLARALEALKDVAARKNAPKEALGEPRALVTAKGRDEEPRWSPDGSRIAFITQGGNDEWFTNSMLAVVPAAGGPSEVLSRPLDEEVSDPVWTPDGRQILFQAPSGTTQQIYRVPASGGAAAPITGGNNLHRSISLSADGRVAAFIQESGGAPVEVFAGPTVAGDGGFDLGPARGLSGLNGWTSRHATASKEIFRWKGAGGMAMEGFLVRPAGATSGGKAPLLTIVHGGPSGVFTNNFSVRRGAYPVQIFAQRGFVVFMPNPRGSGGYGEAFRKANVRDWGEKDYEDIMAGIDALIASGIADPDRLGIMGWSYGGFMTSRTITKTKRFKAASVGAGVTDTFSFTGTSDIPAFMRSYFQAWPWDDPDIYTTRTAVFNAKGVSTPTLIQHGEVDARVPISQGWELYVALREQGVPVEFVTYPRQAHSIGEPKLIRDAMRRNVEWFARWILGEAAP